MFAVHIEFLFLLQAKCLL